MTDSFNDGFLQTSVRQRLLQAFYGSRAVDSEQLDVTRDYVNKDPQAKQSDTLTIASAASAVFTFDGVEYTVSTGSGGAAGDALLVKAYMESQGAIYGAVDISILGAAITLTGKQPGFTYSLVSGANAVAASVTVADEADPISFGRAVVRAGYPAGGTLNVDDTMEAARIADVNAFTAQLLRWDFATLAASDEAGVVIEVVGSDVPAFEVIAEWNANEDDTLDDLATAINAKLVDFGLDSYITAAGPSGAPGAGQLQISADIAGIEFKAAAFSDRDGVLITEDPATIAASSRTSLNLAFAGMSLRSIQEATSLNPSSASIPGNSQFSVAERGDVWVENAEALGYLGKVYVDLTAGAGAGKFYAASGSNRVPLSRGKLEWMKSGRSLDSEALGYLRLK